MERARAKPAPSPRQTSAKSDNALTVGCASRLSTFALRATADKSALRFTHGYVLSRLRRCLFQRKKLFTFQKDLPLRGPLQNGDITYPLWNRASQKCVDETVYYAQTLDTWEAYASQVDYNL